MEKIILINGYSTCGKSTIAEMIAHNFNYEHFSIDKYYKIFPNIAEDNIINDIKSGLEKGNNVVADIMLFTKESYERFKKEFEKYDLKFIHVDSELEKAFERSKTREDERPLGIIKITKDKFFNDINYDLEIFNDFNNLEELEKYVLSLDVFK